MSHFFTVNKFRSFLSDAPSTCASTQVVGEWGRPTQNIERTGDATPLCRDNTQAGALGLLTLRLQGVLEDIKAALNSDNGAQLDAEYYEKLYCCARALDTLIRYLAERSGEASA